MMLSRGFTLTNDNLNSEAVTTQLRSFCSNYVNRICRWVYLLLTDAILPWKREQLGR